MKSKRALVLGSSSGIGKGIAKLLASESVRVCLSSRSKERLEQAQEETLAEVYSVINLRQPVPGEGVVRNAAEKLGGLDILVTNTGGPPLGDFESLSHDDWNEGYRSVWLSAIDSVHAALPKMKQQGFGRILLFTSLVAREPDPNLTVSSAYRAGLLGLMKSLSREVAESEVTVNAILPGLIQTKRLDNFELQLGN